MGEGEERRDIQDRPTSAEMLIAICGGGAQPPRNHPLRAVILVTIDRTERLDPERLPELPEVAQSWLELWAPAGAAALPTMADSASALPSLCPGPSGPRAGLPSPAFALSQQNQYPPSPRPRGGGKAPVLI